MNTGQQPSLFIENCSAYDVAYGNHIDPRARPTVLIQITDMQNVQVTPAAKKFFKEIHQFWFEDTEDVFDIDCITMKDATKIAEILLKAKENRCNIVVNCEAGLCRSGAVVEVAEKLGFIAVERLRIPNTLVRARILHKLFIKS